MHHLEILGNLLTELGFIPYFMGSRNHKWCSDNVQYKFQSIVAMMQYNIKLEEEAIREYKALMHMTEDTYIIHLITRIIKDEEGHLKVFQMMKEKYATCEPS